jgi:hypothetical protein
MAIDMQITKKTFGARSAAATAPKNERPKAQFWLNFGYLTPAGVEGEDDRFVSLPMGIPLDTMEKLSTKSSNADFAQFQAARNDLLDQIIEAASVLEPGQDYVIAADGGLAVQVRRVSEEAAAPPVDATNRYARPKLFAIDGGNKDAA